MIKISIHTESRYRHRFDGIFQVRGLLRDLGYQLEFASDTSARNKADVAWMQSSLLKDCPQDSQPKFCYERYASGTVEDADLISRSDVILYTKEIGYLNKETYLLPLINNRLHTTLLASDLQGERNENLRLHELEKVRVPHAIYRQQKRFDPYFLRSHQKRSSHSSAAKRPIDVFFAGNVHFEDAPGEVAGRLVTTHRKKLAGTLAALPSHVSVLLGLGRSFDAEEFRVKLSQSKIFISPYGWGEYSWKDFEAAISGCILIKPDSSFLKTYGPPLYQEGVITCEPDFSDLQEVIERTLDNLDQEYQKAQAMRCLFVKARHDDEAYAHDLATEFSSIAALQDLPRSSRFRLFARRLART